MDNLGFIHEELDIKILILYILSKLPLPVDRDTLHDLCSFDGGVGYFAFSDCLSDLIDTGHIVQSEDGYLITEKGVKNAEAVANSLPFSVRNKACEMIEPIEEAMRRQSMISAYHSSDGESCTVRLALSDGVGEIMNLSFVCPDEEQAIAVEKKFRKNAEEYYGKVIGLFCGE